MAANEPVATQFKESGDGIGHMLIVPFFTAQRGNVTLLNIVNTDKVNGKVVKVRFRGASNADDLFNFTLFLSPGDVWAAEVNENTTTGFARLSTPDNSCTLPTQLNRDFSTTRLDPMHRSPLFSLDGYIDIITMADVVPGTWVYTTIIQNDDGKLPAICSKGASPPAALRALLTTAGINAAGFGSPTTGLFANWSILNVGNALSWAGAAAAIIATDDKGVAGKGKVVVFPQTEDAPSSPVNDLTSDPLLRAGEIANIQVRQSDFPDLSTPYLDGTTATQQASMLSGALAKTSVRNEYFIDALVNAATDWVMTMPTRRYSVAVDYSTHQRTLTELPTPYFDAANTFMARQEFEISTVEQVPIRLCVSGMKIQFWDRSRKSMLPEIVIEPKPVRQHMVMCGAVATWSIHYPKRELQYVLESEVSFTPWYLDQDPAVGAGWGEIQTPGINNAGLPIIGAAFAKATSPNIGSGISGNFGLVWPHRYTRPGL